MEFRTYRRPSFFFLILPYNTKSNMTITFAWAYLKDSKVRWLIVSLFTLMNANPRFRDAELSYKFTSLKVVVYSVQ